MYYIFCSRAADCKKGGKRLGTFKSEEDCRWALANHLAASSYHTVSQAEADAEAADAIVQTEDWDDADFEPADQGAKGKGKGKSKDAGHRRSVEPYPSKGKGKGKKGEIEMWGASSSASSSWQVQTWSQQPSDQDTKLKEILQAVARSEAAARTAARMARGAATAFESESAVLREAMDTITSFMS